jgi:peptidoglycan L-alanyl-D-glutamate endopeptidase CwlK
MKAAAKKEKVPLEAGIDWVSFKDGPHYQLPWAEYPGTK